jgi:hypothetical protein
LTRYRGTGSGEWRAAWYRYAPSLEDHLRARTFGAAVAARRKASRRSGFGPASEARPEWFARGFLGEVAALYPLGSGPELELYSGRELRGRSDLGPLEVRTTTTRALLGGSDRYPSLAGWIVVAKDAGRIIIAVEDREDDLVVMGWTWARDVPRLAEPIGGVLAVVDYGDLRPLVELAPYAASLE